MKDSANMSTFPVRSILATLILTLMAPSLQAQVFRGPNGNFYEVVVDEGITWEEARLNAEASSLCGKPGHLVTITSAEEDFFVNDIRMAVVGTEWPREFWAGGFQDPNATSVGEGWQWVNGEGLIPTPEEPGPEYSNWFDGEPNNLDAGEFNLAVGLFNSPAWNDEGELFNIAGYIIEYETDATVIIDGCDSGVPNHTVGDVSLGCTIADLIALCAKEAATHEDFVSCIADLTNDLKANGIISGLEKGKIQKCAAQADIPGAAEE